MARPKTPWQERLWPRVDKSGPVPTHDPSLGPCWVWAGYRTSRGYGQIGVEGRHNVEFVHRLVFGLERLLPGQHVRHKCDNPPCCNPDHLIAGTHADNMRDKAERGRAHHPHGEKCGMHKLTDGQVLAIREEYALGGTTHRALARLYDVDHTVIGDVLRRQSFRHI